MPPKRYGYILNKQGQEVYEDFLSHDYQGCTCPTGHPPCSYCTDPGNPISIEENDEFWEKDPEIEALENDDFYIKF